MRLLGVLLLLFLVCQLATSTPILDGDGAGHRQYRSAGFGETIRDWFRVLKNRIVGKWQEWFGNDSPTPRLSPQDILNIDKTLEGRISGYPGLFLDLSSLSLDPKQDWGIRVGNWYIIRKVTGNDYSRDSDSDEWDIKPLFPNLPSFGIDWPKLPDLGIDLSKIPGFGTPQTTRPPTTTPRIESTTLRRETVTRIEPMLTTTESIMTTTESIVTSAEPIPLTTQSIATLTEPIVTSTEEILTFTEPIVTSTEEILTYTEPIVTSTEKISTSSESVEMNNESATVSAESMLPPTEPVIVSIESTIPSTESIVSSTIIAADSTAMSTEEIVTTITTTEPPATSTELNIPILNKRVEENETIDRTTKITQKPRPASAEVIMF